MMFADGIPFTVLTVKASEIRPADRMITPTVTTSGPPITSVESTAAGSLAIITINGGRRTVNAWDRITIIRPDADYLHMTAVWSPSGVELETYWTCPMCHGHRYVATGFPLGGPGNPYGRDLGQTRECKDCGHSYHLPAGTLDINVSGVNR
jgi:rubredoxin